METYWKKAIAVSGVGIALVIVGAFMPWVTIDAGFLGAGSVSGTEGDGVITFSLGVIASFLLLWTYFRPSMVRSIVIAVMSGIVVLIMLQKVTDIGGLIADANLAEYASIGIGIYVSLLGGLAMLAGAVWLAVLSRARRQESESP